MNKLAGSKSQLTRGALVAAALLLAACGAKPDGLAKLPPVKPIPVVATGGGPSEPGEVQAMRARVQAACVRTNNFAAEAYTKMRTPSGGKAFNLAKCFWRRSGTMAATVVDAESEKKVGTKLIFDGKHSVRVRTYFFGFIPLKITLEVDDPRLVDGYKRTLKDTSTERMLETLLDPAAEVRPLGVGEAAGEPVDLFEVRSNLRWKGCDKDVFGVSKRLDLPIMRDAYDGAGKLIFHMEMRQMRTNVTIPAAEWTVD